MIDALNSNTKAERLSALEELKAQIDSGALPAVTPGSDVNNHVHTTYSFSPYSPTAAVWMAYQSGLKTVGIMDHDSISGALEFIKAAEIMGIMSTIGVECRVKVTGTGFEDRRLNNPDQDGIVYMALHGIPHQNIGRVAEFLRPFSEQRGLRNRKMVEKINVLISDTGLSLDYDTDILPLSMQNEGGSVTERHLLYALAKKLSNGFSKQQVIELLQNKLSVSLSAKALDMLSDENNDFYEYDLLGVLKSELVEKFYVNADAECPHVSELIALSNEVRAVSAYAYLGDVGDSVTGDKKTQAFEDSYLDELFVTLKKLGYNAVTYMPSRNTPAQLTRLRALCDEYSFFQISGEDINSPRQKFICMAQRAPEFSNLYDATLALIGHEQAASADIKMAMFGPEATAKTPDLYQRIALYKSLCR